MEHRWHQPLLVLQLVVATRMLHDVRRSSLFHREREGGGEELRAVTGSAELKGVALPAVSSGARGRDDARTSAEVRGTCSEQGGLCVGWKGVGLGPRVDFPSLEL